MKRRNTESSMQLALQAAASNDPEPELFWVSEYRVPCKRMDVTTRVLSRICTHKWHGCSTTRNKRNRPRNSSVWPRSRVVTNLLFLVSTKSGKKKKKKGARKRRIIHTNNIYIYIYIYHNCTLIYWCIYTYTSEYNFSLWWIKKKKERTQAGAPLGNNWEEKCEIWWFYLSLREPLSVTVKESRKWEERKKKKKEKRKKKRGQHTLVYVDTSLYKLK